MMVERQLEAPEFQRDYEHTKIDRDSEHGRVTIEAWWVWYTPSEIADMESDRDEWKSFEHRRS